MKEIILSLFSGLIGVLLTIGYQHFLAPSQSFTFIIEGEEVVVTQSEYMELAQQLEEYESKITDLQKELEQYKDRTDDNTNADMGNDSGDKTVSITTLETFQGVETWWDYSDIPNFRSISSYNFIDTYGNEYPDSNLAEHSYLREKNKFTPVYLLDGKYSKCEGMIAWPKSDKNEEGSVWIEFYSEDELIYQTDPMSASDRALSFAFSVEGIEKLTVVKKAARETGIIYIIYPYFNLVE